MFAAVFLARRSHEHPAAACASSLASVSARSLKNKIITSTLKITRVGRFRVFLFQSNYMNVVYKHELSDYDSQ